MTRSSVSRLLGTVVLALISCASAAEIVEPDGVEARQLDKCAGCSAMVDQVYQRILAAVPNDTRLRVDESTATDVLDAACDLFDQFKMQTVDWTDGNTYSWYRPNRLDGPGSATRSTPEGQAMQRYCHGLVEEHYDPLTTYARSIKKESSRSIQTDICVEMTGLCDQAKLIESAKAFVAAMSGTHQEVNTLERGNVLKADTKADKKKQKKKTKKKKAAKQEL